MPRTDGRDVPAPMPARLHVLLARDAAKAVVIRRGPTRHTAVIGWNRRDDTFQLGQWLYGRIYERRSDLSPDGELLICFAMNGKWSGPAKGSWTAISRAPYLKALTLLPKGDCWNGGGLFLSEREYWLNDGYGHERLRDEAPARRVAHAWTEEFGGECPGVYYHRLQRDGWRMQSIGPRDGDRIATFDKPLTYHWVLRKLAVATLVHPPGKGHYFDTHQLCNARTGEVLERPDWEWADWDGKRLLYAKAGGLYAARVNRDGDYAEHLLQDFNAMRFERLTAPYD
jgi:hypothetical protein